MTAYGQDTDSIKYSVRESKALIDAYLNYPLALDGWDSCEVKAELLKRDLDGQVNLTNLMKEQIGTQKEYISKSDKLVTDLTGKLEKSDKWKKRWRFFTGVLASGIIITIFAVK